MTPKEKAIDLFVKNFELIPDYIKQIDAKHIAKYCALIAVDEILKGIVPKDDDERYTFELGGNQFYWEEVKQEIEKL